MCIRDRPDAELSQILDQYGINGDALEPPCNLTLYRDDTRTVLFDAGAGTEFMPSAGKLADSLDALGVDPTEVTHVVFTHAHPDHIWGILDDFGDLAFPEAEYLIGQEEWDYWTDPNTVEIIGEARAAFAVGAKRRLDLIEDRITRFEDGQEVLPGITAMATFGHTPGHMALDIMGEMLVLGDAIANHHVAFARPEWQSGSDQDRAIGAATRTKLLSRLAASEQSVLGFHLPDGGMGRVARAGEGYQFNPL